MNFHKHQLANGLTVIAELNPHVYSVAMGFFVRAGSRDETAEVSGVSHFLEHMAFKGTARRTANDVNREFDDCGAKYNASTSEEVTLFYAAVLPEYLPGVCDVLADILRPSLRAEDFEMEKNVILEEIGMYDDSPAFLAYDLAMREHFAGHPLSQSILGSVESITALTVEQMRDYYRDRYQAGSITLAVSGNYEWEKVVELAESCCGDWPAGNPVRARPKPVYQPKSRMIVRPGSLQQHVVAMSEAPFEKDRLRYAAELLTVIVGDDCGSRLYWELADPGYVDAVDLGYHEYDAAASFMTYLCCDPASVKDNLARIAAIYDDVNRYGVQPAELEQARSKVASRVVLRSERPMGRLSSLGGNWVARQEYRSVADDLRTIDEITLNDMREVLEQFPLGQTTLVGVGPMESLE